ncbi:unnamed protein product, partial [Discosporangium mesarthrocarpum]
MEEELEEVQEEDTGGEDGARGGRGTGNWRSTPKSPRKEVVEAVEERAMSEDELCRIEAEGEPEDRVSLWDCREQRRQCGNCAPKRRKLRKYLELYPHLVLYNGQQADGS